MNVSCCNTGNQPPGERFSHDFLVKDGATNFRFDQRGLLELFAAYPRRIPHEVSGTKSFLGKFFSRLTPAPPPFFDSKREMEEWVASAALTIKGEVMTLGIAGQPLPWTNSAPFSLCPFSLQTYALRDFTGTSVVRVPIPKTNPRRVLFLLTIFGLEPGVKGDRSREAEVPIVSILGIKNPWHVQQAIRQAQEQPIFNAAEAIERRSHEIRVSKDIRVSTDVRGTKDPQRMSRDMQRMSRDVQVGGALQPYANGAGGRHNADSKMSSERLSSNNAPAGLRAIDFQDTFADEPTAHLTARVSAPIEGSMGPGAVGRMSQAQRALLAHSDADKSPVVGMAESYPPRKSSPVPDHHDTHMNEYRVGGTAQHGVAHGEGAGHRPKSHLSHAAPSDPTTTISVGTSDSHVARGGRKGQSLDLQRVHVGGEPSPPQGFSATDRISKTPQPGRVGMPLAHDRGVLAPVKEETNPHGLHARNEDILSGMFKSEDGSEESGPEPGMGGDQGHSRHSGAFAQAHHRIGPGVSMQERKRDRDEQNQRLMFGAIA